MLKRVCTCTAFVITIAAILVLPAYGQAVTGSITGHVYDPSGAPVPNATVLATNVLTGIETTRNTDSTGLYLITNLLPGTYSVAVEAKGFKRFVQENIVLRVDSKINIDAQLELGEVTQEVTVNAAPPMLQTEKADVNVVLPEQTIESLPTVGRNISRLHLLAPGTSAFIFQQPAGENPSLGATVVANGQFWGSNEYQIDGITDVEFGSSGMQIVTPNQDSVQEVKVTTSNYDAELGQVSGLAAQYVTKSGTNALHGSLFWFNRNNKVFAANPFSEKVAGTGPQGKGIGTAPFRWNQGGGSVGGPIKKNKMFFFGDYQFNRTREGSSQLATVPLLDFQRGDFSSIAATHPIFDPLTGSPDGTGRTQFSCNGRFNVICPDRFNPVSVKLLDLLNGELANRFIDQSKANNNFASSGSSSYNQDQFDVRYDVNISDKDKAFVRYTYFTALLNNPAIFGLAGGPAVSGLSPQTGEYRNHHGVINYTHTFGPTLLTEGRIGLTRFGLRGLQFDVGHNTNDEVGIKGINSGDPLTQGLAGITVSGPVNNWFMGIPTGVGIPRIQFNTVIQGANNWTKINGDHELRWGFDIRRQRFDFLTLNESSRGNFQFDQLITASAGVPGSGLGMASFLLGLPSEYDRANFSQFPAERNTRIAWYWQDAWRVTPKLSFNYGVRYEYIGPSTPRFPGGGVNYDPETGNLLLSGLG